MKKSIVLTIIVLLCVSCSNSHSIYELKTSSRQLISQLERFSYDKYNLIDNKIYTSWQVRNKNNGIGEWIEIRFNAEQSIDKLKLYNGFQYIDNEFGDLYYLNSRAKRIKVCINGFKCYDQYIPDTKEPVTINIDEPNVKLIKLTILEVYKGSRWDEDLAISEIKIVYNKPFYLIFMYGIVLLLIIVPCYIKRKEIVNAITSILKKDDFNHKTYEKGKEFEYFIAEILNKSKEFEMERWTYDINNKRKGIYIKSDANPDFMITHKKSNKKFFVKCNYRSKTLKNIENQDVVNWASQKQIKRYNDIAKRENIEAYIIIGLMGIPSNPEYVFCVPLSEAKHTDIYLNRLQKYVRIPKDKAFALQSGQLK